MVSVPVKQSFATDVTPEEFNAHANAADRFKQSISAYLGTQPDGSPYTIDNIEITSVGVGASTRRRLSGNPKPSQRQLANSLEIDYIIRFAVRNVDAGTFVRSPALATITNALITKLSHASFAIAVTTDLTTTSADSSFVGFSNFAAATPVLSLAGLAVTTTQGAPSALPTYAPADSTAASEESQAVVIAGVTCGGLLSLILVSYAWFRAIQAKKKRAEVMPDADTLELGKLVAISPAAPATHHGIGHRFEHDGTGDVKQGPLKFAIASASACAKGPDMSAEEVAATAAAIMGRRRELTVEEEDAMLDALFAEEEAEQAAVTIMGRRRELTVEEEDAMLDALFAEEEAEQAAAAATTAASC